MIRFRSIPKPTLETIRPFLRAYEPSQSYPRGAELFHEGTPAKSVFVMTSGIVRLQCAGGKEGTAILALRTPGAMPGGLAALSGTPYPFSATAVTRCDAYRLPSDDYCNLVRNEQVFSWYVHQLQAHDIQQSMARIAGLSVLSARERLESFLDDLADALPPSTTNGEVPLRDRELAQIVAVTPPYLSRLLKRLIEDGRLRRSHGALFILERMASAR